MPQTHPHGAIRDAALGGTSILMKVPPTVEELPRWMAVLGSICGVRHPVRGFVRDRSAIGPNLGTALASRRLWRYGKVRCPPETRPVPVSGMI